MFRKGLKICFHGWVPGWLAGAIETKAISASNKVEVEAELGNNLVMKGLTFTNPSMTLKSYSP